MRVRKKTPGKQSPVNRFSSWPRLPRIRSSSITGLRRVSIGQLLNVRIAVRNGGATSLPTQEPGSGFVYDEEDTFVTWGFADVGGNFRVGIDFDNRVGLDHPYRWGIGDTAGGRARRALSRERFD